jgi:hypothetical protein
MVPEKGQTKSAREDNFLQLNKEIENFTSPAASRTFVPLFLLFFLHIHHLKRINTVEDCLRDILKTSCPPQ